MLYSRATRWLSAPNVELRVALLALLVSLPSLVGGLHGDDLFLRQNLEQRGPLAAYEFVSRDPEAAHAELLRERDDGRAPWWADEHPRASFFRPLSSLWLWADFTLGAPPWWMHLENALLYAVIVWLAAGLYRALGLSGAALGWSALFFALHAPLAQTVGWVAGRDTLVGAALGVACLLAHDRARRARDARWLALAAALFALALLGAEYGLCTLGFLAAHALFMDRAPPARRALALAPYAVVTSAYLAAYVTGGYGFNDGGIYRDVLHAPALAVAAWLESIPVWIATTATLPVATFRLLAPDVRLPLLAFSVVASLLVAAYLGARAVREPHARMLALGAALSVVPLAATLPQERLQFFVALGLLGLLGPAVASDLEASERVRRWTARLVWGWHGVLVPLLFVPYVLSMIASDAPAVALDAALPRASEPTVILLNPPSWSVGWLARTLRTTAGEPGPHVYTLYAGTQLLDVTRIDDQTIELHVERSWSTTPFEEHVRNPARSPLHPGDHVDTPAFRADVLDVSPAGAATRVRVRFDRSLDASTLAFEEWRADGPARWTPIAVGEHATLRPPAAF